VWQEWSGVRVRIHAWLLPQDGGLLKGVRPSGVRATPRGRPGVLAERGGTAPGDCNNEARLTSAARLFAVIAAMWLSMPVPIASVTDTPLTFARWSDGVMLVSSRTATVFMILHAR
jgi:hypothetical protein